MSEQSIADFLNKAASDPTLSAEIKALDSDQTQRYAEALAQLAQSVGIKCSAQDFIESGVLLSDRNALKEADIQNVSGGSNEEIERAERAAWMMDTTKK